MKKILILLSFVTLLACFSDSSSNSYDTVLAKKKGCNCKGKDRNRGQYIYS